MCIKMAAACCIFIFWYRTQNLFRVHVCTSILSSEEIGSICNASSLYSGGTELESRPGHRRSWLRFFVGFLSSPDINTLNYATTPHFHILAIHCSPPDFMQSESLKASFHKLQINDKENFHLGFFLVFTAKYLSVLKNSVCMWSTESQLMFRMNISPPSSGSKNKSSKKSRWTR
jgi:hypothetical protein